MREIIKSIKQEPYYRTELGALYCGDCLELMKEIPEKSVDLVLTDPPYGIDFQSNMRVVSEKFSKLENDDNEFRLKTYPLFFDMLKYDCIAGIFCSFKNYATDYTELSKFFDIKNCIIWDKGGGGIGDLNHSLLTDYEMILICHKGNCEIRGKREGSVWGCGKVNPNIMKHPTQKPEGICNKVIGKFSDKDSMILDPFLGSGTTALACEKLGRRWIGIEISEKYCEIAKDRIKSEADQVKMEFK